MTTDQEPANREPAIVGYGVYRPRFRLGAGRRRVTVRNGDEDALTLAVESAQDLIARHGRDLVGDLDGIVLAVGRPELTDGPQPEMIREALGLDPHVRISTTAGDALAGLAALQSAIDAVAAGRSQRVLVLASEPGDGARVSAAAVALLVTRGGETPSLRLLEQSALGDVVYGNWSDAEGTRHPGDGRYLEHRVADSAARTWLAVTGEDADLAAAGSRVPAAVTGVAATAAARACGAGAGVVVPDHGVAGPLLALLKGSATNSGTAHIVATTAGRVVVVTMRSEPGAPCWLPPDESPDDPPRPPTEAESSPPLSLPTSSPFFRRAARELLRLEGARCRGCGHVMFPPSQRPVCSGCGSFDFEPAALSRTGSVYSFVVNRFLPRGFGDQMALVLGDMDDGSRYWAPTSGVDTARLAIGAPVELRLRRFTGHGGAPTYAMKFVSREAVR